MPTAPRPLAVATATMGSAWRGKRYLPSTPSRLLITYCWAIDKMLFVNQYSTRPDGNTKNILSIAQQYVINKRLGVLGK